MRIGVIGQAGQGRGELRKAIELFLSDPEIKQVIYLGADGAVDAVATDWAQESLHDDAFLSRAAALAPRGTADEITALLAEYGAAERLGAVRKLPDPPARAIEMLEKWIVLAVHDKSILDEDDIANAHVIVYGKASDADFKRFGPRAFLTPGPLAKGKVGRISLRPDGHLDVDLLDLQGAVVQHEELAPADSKVVVTS